VTSQSPQATGDVAAKGFAWVYKIVWFSNYATDDTMMMQDDVQAAERRKEHESGEEMGTQLILR
jgi:hypothetical protein